MVRPDAPRPLATALLGAGVLLAAAWLGAAGFLGGCSKSGSSSGSTCGNAVRATSYDGGAVIQLGAHPVNTELAFAVPAGTAGFTVLSQAVSAADHIQVSAQAIENTAVPLTITQPDGGVVYDDVDLAFFPADPSGLPVYFGGRAGWTGTLTVPNTSQMLRTVQQAGGLPAGTWRLVVNDWANECKLVGGCTASATGVYQITVLLKPMFQADGGTQVARDSGTLDVAFYFATESGLDATKAKTSAAFQRMVESIRYFVGNAGVTLGAPSYVDLPADARKRYSTVDADKSAPPCGELSQLLALSKAGNTLNFFLVDAITSASLPQGYSIAGLDGTIPGPATVGGTVASGAAVSVADLGWAPTGVDCTDTAPIDLRCGSDFTGYVAAHEAGHFLGLYHPTEISGDLFDSLDDTGQCPCATCTLPPPDGGVVSYCASSPTMEAASCNGSTGCAGADNLMFWVVSPSLPSIGNLTAEQGLVARANPLVH